MRMTPAEKSRKFRQAHPGYTKDRNKKQGPNYVRNRWLKTGYGITIEEYLAMLERQNGKCAVQGCTEPPGGRGKVYHVDHDHKTGRVRGLLCSNCNRALGLLRENIERIQGLAAYLVIHV